MKNKKIILGLGTITALGAMSVGFIACVKKEEIEDMKLADKAGLEELKTKIGDLEKKLKDAIDEKTKKLAKQIDDKTTNLSELIKNLVIEKIDLINDILEDKFGVQMELITELIKSTISIITDDLTNLVIDKTKDLSKLTNDQVKEIVNKIVEDKTKEISNLTKNQVNDLETILAQIIKNILENKISQDEEIKKLKDQLEDFKKTPIMSKSIEDNAEIKSIIKYLDKLEDVNEVLGEIKINGVKQLKAEPKDGSSTDVLVKIIVESDYRLVGKDTFEIKDAIKTNLNLADIEGNTEIKKIENFENLDKVNEALQKITIPGVTRLKATLDGQSTTDVVVTIKIDATKYTLDKKTFKIANAIKKEVKLNDIKDKFKDIKGKSLKEVQDKLNKLLPQIEGVKSLIADLNADKKTITINITMKDTHKIDTTRLVLEDVIEIEGENNKDKQDEK